ARGHREPDHGGAHALQRGGARLQHAAQALSRQHGRLLPRLQGEGLLRGRARQRAAAQGEVLTRPPSASGRLGAGLARALAAAVLLLALAAAAAAALKVPPPPDRRVNDYAGVLAPAERERLEEKVIQRE